MGLGILEDRKLAKVPGTVILSVEDKTTEDQATHQLNPTLKYDLSGPRPIVLVPQPSDDPNDPLNWPLWKRDVILVILCLISILAATLGPILAANAMVVMSHFDTTITGIALLTGYHLVGVGAAGVFFVPSARIWGKRHQYLLGTILLIGSSIWGALATSYRSFLWARILQGVAVCPFEALVNVSVADMYCVHQRGMRMAFSNLSLYGGAFFTPVVVGILTERMGYEWTFWFVAIFSGVLFPLVIFYVPETAYRRPAHLNINENSINEQSFDPHSDGQLEARSELSEKNSTSAAPPKESYKSSLRPFNGRKTDDQFWKLCVRPLVLLFHPAILWGMLTQGTLIGWTVMIGVDVAALYALPPTMYTAAQTGYTYAGAFGGGLLGFLLSGWLSDWSAKALTRLNNGVYEPEFRIVLVIPQMIFGCLGVFGFGFTMQDLRVYGVPLSIFFFGLEVMGMVIGAVSSALYIVDAHGDIAIEAFTCMLMFKNFFSFGITWIAFEWLVKEEVWVPFKTVGLIQVGVCLLSVPMYILGKRNRSLMYRHDLLKYTHLNTVSEKAKLKAAEQHGTDGGGERADDGS